MIVDERVKKISDHHGYGHQSRQCIEEMAELTQAINKVWRYRKKRKNKYKRLAHIYEEIADVEICLDHLKYLLNCHDEVQAMRDYKLNREIKRIGKG